MATIVFLVFVILIWKIKYLQYWRKKFSTDDNKSKSVNVGKPISEKQVKPLIG